MPHLIIQTNQVVPEEKQNDLLAAASKLAAQSLAKPESYMMVSLKDPCPMCFAGTTGPAAYLELKSIGLNASQASTLSRLLCAFMQEQLGIPPDRVYIEFSDAAPGMWGWDSKTFG